MPKTVEEMTETFLKNIEVRTGKPTTEWITLARGTGLVKHKQILTYLQTEHGFSYGDANAIALRALQSAEGPAPSGDDLVVAQYSGAKSVLKPIYEALILAVESFGPDVEIAPKKGYVSLRRSKQFALVQPTTASRLDVGIQLKGMAPTARLEASGSFNAMVSHRVRIGDVKEVDSQLTDWLRAAYDAA